MNEYLSFRKMITPLIIQILFWLGIVVIVISAIAAMFSGQGGFFQGLLLLVFGTLGWRIYCELIMVFFQMNGALQEIRDRSVNP